MNVSVKSAAGNDLSFILRKPRFHALACQAELSFGQKSLHLKFHAFHVSENIPLGSPKYGRGFEHIAKAPRPQEQFDPSKIDFARRDGFRMGFLVDLKGFFITVTAD